MEKKKKPILILIIAALVLITLCLFTLLIISYTNPSSSFVSTAVFETLSSLPTSTVISTHTPYPTYTPNILVVTATNSPTPRFTATNTLTPTTSSTPTSTSTMLPTATATKKPGVGTEMSCGDSFKINVIEKPRRETYFYGEKSNGEFWLLKLEITNLMNQNHSLHDSDFGIAAKFNNQDVIFESSWDATFDWVYHQWGGVIYPNDDIGPTLTAKVGIAFDVNPNAEEFSLIWFPRDNMFDSFDESICQVIIPLE